MNGARASRPQRVEPQGSNNAPVTFGSAAGFLLDGSVDEVRLWSVVRTPSQILGTMSSPLDGDEPCLEAYWRMDESSGTTLTDSTGKGRTAQLRGNPQPIPSQARLSTQPIPVSLPPQGGRQAKARATITGPHGWIQQADLTDGGEGYGSESVGVYARGSQGFSWVGSYSPFSQRLSVFSLQSWTDDTAIPIEPPRSNDLQIALDNPQVNEIPLEAGTYFQNAVIDRNLVIRGAGKGETTRFVLDPFARAQPGFRRHRRLGDSTQ